jgi:UDP-N-acetylmuramate: L-alanyl-gamma-D-glutamyl-meso-diaminopimelate ligase
MSVCAGMRVHLIAVAGTGMGSLAGLLKAAGHEVSGSDVAFHPPMGPALERWGIRLLHGFDPAHLDDGPDLIVVGNVCRPDNVEARAAFDRGLRVTSMVGALGELALAGTSPLVVAGTHGKTTTTALAAWLLDQAGLEPGFLVGGLPRDFAQSFQLAARGQRTLPKSGARRVPFVIEGDEYDTAYFDKTPKFWHYRPEVAIVTSIEHDHVDIYPDEASYLAAFAGFVARVPEHGLIVAHAGDARVVEVVQAHARAEVAWYALQGEELHGCPPHWLAAPAASDASGQSFDLFAGGVAAGRAAIRLSGAHNVANATAALAAVCQGYGVPLGAALGPLAAFRGVARRQEVLGTPRGVTLYDDFAHHPTAVRETLRGLRARHPHARLWAIYEPRTATACRRLHQEAYLEAFDAADRVVLPPLGRDLPPEESLDLELLCRQLGERGVATHRAASLDEILALVVSEAASGDVVALLSNGAFGGLPARLNEALDPKVPTAPMMRGTKLQRADDSAPRSLPPTSLANDLNP